MRAPWCLLTAIVFLGSACNRISFPDGGWDAESATFTWRTGSVRLPPGFTYRRSRGGDSFEGPFSSPDRKLVVDHDIGAPYISGVYASREGSLVFNERIINDVRVWTATKDQPLPNGLHTFRFAVTFLDSDCANFFLYSSNPEDAVTIDFIARSFEPRGPANPDSGPRPKSVNTGLTYNYLCVIGRYPVPPKMLARPNLRSGSVR
jgi:hypothetical protein